MKFDGDGRKRERVVERMLSGAVARIERMCCASVFWSFVFLSASVWTSVANAAVADAVGSSITVQTPTEQWKIGGTYDFTWSATDVQFVTIRLCKGGGVMWEYPSPVPASQGVGRFTVPFDYPVGGDYWLWILSAGDASVYGVSDMFGITVGTPAITKVYTPTGTLRPGSACEIKWESAYVEFLTIRVCKGTGQGAIKKVLRDIPASAGSYSWKIPTAFKSGGDYWFWVIAAADKNVANVSDMFWIYPKALINEVATPDYTLTASDTYMIEWSSTGVSQVAIKICKGDVVMGEVASVSSGKKGGDYIFDLSSSWPAGDDYWIWVIDENDANVYGVSGMFSIAAAPAVWISTKTPDIWYIGKSNTFTWTAQGLSYVRIQICKGDKDALFEIPYPVPASQGEGVFTVPADYVKGSNYWLRIEDYYNASINNASYDFQVTYPALSVDTPKETWYAGNKYELSWSAQGVDYVTIMICKGIGPDAVKLLIPMVSAYPGVGKFTVPADYVTDGDYWIWIVDEADANIYGVSDMFWVVKE